MKTRKTGRNSQSLAWLPVFWEPESAWLPVFFRGMGLLPRWLPACPAGVGTGACVLLWVGTAHQPSCLLPVILLVYLFVKSSEICTAALLWSRLPSCLPSWLWLMAVGLVRCVAVGDQPFLQAREKESLSPGATAQGLWRLPSYPLHCAILFIFLVER